MKELMKMVNNNYLANKEELKVEFQVLKLMKNFFKTLNQKQGEKFLQYLVERDKLEDIKIENYISITYKVCKDVFDLR